MRPGEYEPPYNAGGGSVGDLDADSAFFGFDEDPSDDVRRRPTRSDRHRRSTSRRHARRGRLLVVVLVVIVAVVLAIGIPKIKDHFTVKNYSGNGTSAVVEVTIPSGASATDIGALLKAKDVVASTEAFTDAANSNANSKNIQPGTYNLHPHMSGSAAVIALLNPANRNAADDAVIPEGSTVLDVEKVLVRVLGSSQLASLKQYIAHGADLGLPVNYGSLTGSPEGFLFPATYTFDPGTTGEQALQEMVQRFIAQDRQTGFAGDAAAVKLKPYAALIIASIAQAEAKFPADMPKVARVIMNRIAAGMPLQIDATSAYAAKLQGLDPTKVIYNQIQSPYNTYLHQGLPPTPIDNPGATAMNAAVHPAAGNWLYYVNSDAKGDLFFTNSETAFAAAVAKCQKNNWGCG